MVIYSSHVLEMRREGGDRRADPPRLAPSSRTIRCSRLRELMALPSLEQVFKKVVLAADVDEVARDLVGVMRAVTSERQQIALL